MNSSISYSSSDTLSERSQEQAIPLESSPTERRSTRTTEVVYALFALAVGILLFATAV